MYAIDRATMAKQLLPGGSQVIDTPCYPSQFGCDVSAAVKYPYDPAKAKQLLAAAGYPNGFSTTLVSYMSPQINAAIQNYLRAVGITLQIQQLQDRGSDSGGAAGQDAALGRQLGQQFRQRHVRLHAVFPWWRAGRLRAGS